jgi:transcriptional regulator with XRE-family HTH domain
MDLFERLILEAGMVINNAADFGEALKKRRKELGYTQRYISEFTGFSISFISDLENGKSTAELGKAIYLANMLGLDIAVNARGDK